VIVLLVAFGFIVSLACLVLYAVFRARRVRDVTPAHLAPLAGFDTGVRSPYRLPVRSRLVRFDTRGF